MTNYVYHKIDYVNGVKVGEFKSQSLPTKKLSDNQVKTLSGDSWLSNFLYCISRYIFSYPRKLAGGGWECRYGFDFSGGNEGIEDHLQPGDSGGGGINMDKYFPIVFPPNPFQPGGHQASPPSVWDFYYFTPPGGGLFITLPEADEKELGVSDFSPQNLWWDDNIFDQNVDYKKQTKPSWNNVFKNYPKNSSGGDLDVSNVCALIGGELSSSGITNACAIRVSRALNYSGITIPEIVGQTKKGGDGKNYFLYASHLKNWLSKVLGPPDIHKKVSEIGIDPSKYYDHLIGIQNRGIYIMKPKSAESFGATGHATLWGGLDCIGGKNYFGAASDVYIWRLPQ